MKIGCAAYSYRDYLLDQTQGLRQGVVLALENHGGITATAEQTLALLKAVDSPWLRANLDFGNYSRDPYQEFRLVAPYAVTTHAKVSWYEGGYGSGTRHTVDYTKVKQILDEVGYRGFISIEYEEPEDARTGVPTFVKHLRSIF
ncbi:MAG: sugar phosphate isomerase/epimerase family protein [Anaerolineae bacterium]